MITKIFYSLVLFPNITYGSLINSYCIYSIVESSYGEIKIIFKKEESFEYIYFTHNDFKKNDIICNTRNWQISGKNQDLVKKIYELVIINEINDFNFFKEKSFYDKIPFGTVLTLTSKCNLFCNYCFNDYDYLLKDRNKIKGLDISGYKKIIDVLYDAGTRDIIITGGEPFTSPILFEVLEYLKSKGIFIRINTNGSLLFDKILEKLNKNFSLNLMVSIHEFNNEDYYNTNKLGAKNILGLDKLKGFEKKFEQKIEQLKRIKEHKNITLDFLTILTPKNILYLEKIYDFVLNNFDLENWDFFRLYSTKTTKGISKELLILAIHKIHKLNSIHKTNFKIVDSVPFCITKNLKIASEIIDGELSIHHNIKTIITTEGNIQIMSAFDTNLGSIFENDLLEVWQGDCVQKMLNQGFLPKECKNCKYKEECRGGSRMEANIYNGSYGALDPFANLDNKIEI